MEIRYCLEFTRGRATTVKKKKMYKKVLCASKVLFVNKDS